MRNPSLRHVYASLADLNDSLVQGGAGILTDAGNNALKLEMLDEVSRLIDARAHRGSGFGPWVGTNQYDGTVKRVIDPHDTLWLRADLAELDTLSILSSVGATPITPTVETDFYLAGLGGYEPPYRRIILNGVGTPTRFGHGRRVTSVAGTWSYPYRTRVLVATLADNVAVDDTDIPVSGITELSPGLTLLLDDEQVYVIAVTDAVDMDPAFITVERAVNGTEAATHADESVITGYVYDASVHTCALRLAQRRWQARDAGADGSDGGGDVGVLSPHEGEDTIIRRMLGSTVMLVGNV